MTVSKSPLCSNMKIARNVEFSTIPDYPGAEKEGFEPLSHSENTDK